MKIRLLMLVAAALVTGCASSPPPPDWQTNAHLALKNYEAAELAGNTRLADEEFARGRAELARTGRADLVARAELLRCAVRGASLAFDDCPGFRAIAADSAPREQAYLDYLAGRWHGLDASLLPEQHRAVIGAGELPAEPVARLVAAAALLRVGRITPAVVAAAVEVASANGWRRPLLAWLSVEEKRAVSAGDNDAAARIRRRIELVTSKGGR